MSDDQDQRSRRGCLGALLGPAEFMSKWIIALLGLLAALITFTGVLITQGYIQSPAPKPNPPLQDAGNSPREPIEPDERKGPSPAATPSASASPASYGSLEELAPVQVGDYQRVSFANVPNDIGASESLSAEYSTPLNMPLTFYVWVYASADAAKAGQQKVLQYYAPSAQASASVGIPGTPGEQGGDGTLIYSDQGEQIVWCDHSLLAAIEAPSTPHAQVFFEALYGQQWGAV